MKMNLDGIEIWSYLIGRFNAYNFTAVYATAMALEEKEGEVLTLMSQLRPVEGRFETIRSNGGVIGIIDYAHTPDAIKNVLETINEIRTRNETLITLVGAGGDRDRSKRPEMARIAASLSDKVILTSDNPRSEDPEAIIAEMKSGLDPVLSRKTMAIVSRKEAIQAAAVMAKSGDIILVAGKGHEKYQEIQGIKHPFDDKDELTKALRTGNEESNS
jgi:UDP-N-acetylmuramoyl-L-alanyl-D-glutamate--2,6-diaminopimelate ligase